MNGAHGTQKEMERISITPTPLHITIPGSKYIQTPLYSSDIPINKMGREKEKKEKSFVNC